jgi:hypothetical protein
MYEAYFSASQGLISRTLARTFKGRSASAPDPAVVGSAMVYDFTEDTEGAAETVLQLEDSSVPTRVSKAWQQLHGAATRLLEPLAQSTERLRFALR